MDGTRKTDDPRWRRKNVGIMALGGLLILAGLAVILGLTPAPKSADVEKLQHYIAAGLVAAGLPFLVLGNGQAAFATIRSFIPGSKGRGSSEFPSVPTTREPRLPEDR